MKTLKPTCWKRINGNYCEPSKIVWEYESLVRIAHNDFEVIDVKIEQLYGYDRNGESVANYYAPIQTLKDHASSKALESLETIDFESED